MPRVRVTNPHELGSATVRLISQERHLSWLGWACAGQSILLGSTGMQIRFAQHANQDLVTMCRRPW
jgi:hypothetical protein